MGSFIRMSSVSRAILLSDRSMIGSSTSSSISCSASSTDGNLSSCDSSAAMLSSKSLLSFSVPLCVMEWMPKPIVKATTSPKVI